MSLKAPANQLYRRQQRRGTLLLPGRPVEHFPRVQRFVGSGNDLALEVVCHAHSVLRTVTLEIPDAVVAKDLSRRERIGLTAETNPPIRSGPHTFCPIAAIGTSGGDNRAAVSRVEDASYERRKTGELELHHTVVGDGGPIRGLGRQCSANPHAREPLVGCREDV